MFTGHSMGGGIAVMASLLLRASGDYGSASTSSCERAQHQRNKQQEQESQPEAVSEAVSTALDLDEGQQPDCLARGEQQEPKKHQEKNRKNVTAQEEEEAWRRDLEVISFATPCCVSLELAQRCKPWVTSLVYADDLVPRLSMVSLDLLKEDMTGERQG